MSLTIEDEQLPRGAEPLDGRLDAVDLFLVHDPAPAAMLVRTLISWASLFLTTGREGGQGMERGCVERCGHHALTLTRVITCNDRARYQMRNNRNTRASR